MTRALRAGDEAGRGRGWQRDRQAGHNVESVRQAPCLAGRQASRQADIINSVLKNVNKYIIMRQKTSGDIGGAIKRTNFYVILP